MYVPIDKYTNPQKHAVQPNNTEHKRSTATT